MDSISNDDDGQSFNQGPTEPNRVIVFSRLPQSGLTKTRMIESLGADRAADLQHALTSLTLSVVDKFRSMSPCDLEVRFAGGDKSQMRKAFGHDRYYLPQIGENLGERLVDAFASAFANGAKRIVAIGSDCPDINPEILQDAIESLAKADVVVGPAIDGGYYLIGLSSNRPEIFESIDWANDNVRQQTIQNAKRSNCKVHQLRTLSDVDNPEDLVHCRRYPDQFKRVLPKSRDGLLSIIIPTLNEAKRIDQTLARVIQTPNVEVVVADGGSSDDTIAIARSMGAAVVSANRGRGRQMNAAAAIAGGDALLFLHADTELPESFDQNIRATLARGAIAGAFSLRIDGDRLGLRMIERAVNLRSRFLNRPYGDQGLFVASSWFYQVGGFPNWPLMEDVELCRRLRRRGTIAMANATVKTSARRWSQLGLVKTTVVNQVCIAGYWCGVKPETLHHWYRSRL